MDKKVNDIESLTDLKTLLESDAGEIARRLDSWDGDFDGKVDIKFLNDWLTQNGYQPIQNKDGSQVIAYLDVVKLIYHLKSKSKEN